MYTDLPYYACCEYIIITSTSNSSEQIEHVRHTYIFTMTQSFEFWRNIAKNMLPLLPVSYGIIFWNVHGRQSLHINQ